MQKRGRGMGEVREGERVEGGEQTEQREQCAV